MSMPEVHPLAQIFPPDDGENLKELAADIKKNGQLRRIVLLDGKILDGRRRWLACQMARVKPETVTFDGDNPASFVRSENAHRRHLTAEQKSWAILESEKWEEENGFGKKKKSESDKAAKEAGVPPRTHQRNRRIAKKASPEVVKAVKEGKLTAGEAEKTIPKKDRKLSGKKLSGKAINLSDFYKLIGAVARFGDEVHESEGKANKVQHATFLCACDGVEESWRKWQKPKS